MKQASAIKQSNLTKDNLRRAFIFNVPEKNICYWSRGGGGLYVECSAFSLEFIVNDRQMGSQHNSYHFISVHKDIWLGFQFIEKYINFIFSLFSSLAPVGFAVFD